MRCCDEVGDVVLLCGEVGDGPGGQTELVFVLGPETFEPMKNRNERPPSPPYCTDSSTNQLREELNCHSVAVLMLVDGWFP